MELGFVRSFRFPTGRIQKKQSEGRERLMQPAVGHESIDVRLIALRSSPLYFIATWLSLIKLKLLRAFSFGFFFAMPAQPGFHQKVVKRGIV